MPVEIFHPSHNMTGMTSMTSAAESMTCDPIHIALAHSLAPDENRRTCSACPIQRGRCLPAYPSSIGGRTDGLLAEFRNGLPFPFSLGGGRETTRRRRARIIRPAFKSAPNDFLSGKKGLLKNRTQQFLLSYLRKRFVNFSTGMRRNLCSVKRAPNVTNSCSD